MKNQYSIICPKCGATNPMDQKRCINCGATLPSPQVRPTKVAPAKRSTNRLILSVSIVLLALVMIILAAHNQVRSNRTVSYNPAKVQLLNRQKRVVRTIYYTKKVEQSKGNNIYGKVVLIPRSKMSQVGYPLKKAYQQAKHHYPYHLNLAHHQAEVRFQGHLIVFEHMKLNDGSWIKESPVEPLKTYPSYHIKYYRYFYLNDY